MGRGSNQAAESCHLLLERVATSVKSLSPAYMLAHELPLIVPFVRRRLEQLPLPRPLPLTLTLTLT